MRNYKNCKTVYKGTNLVNEIMIEVGKLEKLNPYINWSETDNILLEWYIRNEGIKGDILVLIFKNKNKKITTCELNVNNPVAMEFILNGLPKYVSGVYPEMYPLY